MTDPHGTIGDARKRLQDANSPEVDPDATPTLEGPGVAPGAKRGLLTTGPRGSVVMSARRGTMGEAERCVNTARPLTRSTSTTPKEGLAMKATRSSLVRCRKCEELRPSRDFYVQVRNGRTYVSKTCDRCSKKRRAAREATAIRARGGRIHKDPERLTVGGMTGAERHAYWANYKERMGCIDCGSRDWRTLEFDHLPEFEKSFTIGQAIRQTGYYSDDQIEAEVEKCEVVCGPCHRRRTSARGRNNIPRSADAARAIWSEQ